VSQKFCFVDEQMESSWWSPEAGQIGVGDFFGKNKGHVLNYRNLQIRKLQDEER